MRNQKKLVLEQLDRKLSAFYDMGKIQIPEKGWIRSIRTALNMTLEQFGNKMGMTKQGAKKIEASESSASISLKSLKEVARVLDLSFVYAFVPNAGSFEKMVEEKSRHLAKKIVLRANQNMLLEDQSMKEERIESAIEELSQEIKREMRRSIWD